nr:response regulator transcription factor [Bacteroidota bacterium]
HILFRHWVVSLLNTLKNVEVIGEAENGLKLMELLKSVKPNIILMDIKMPELNGIEATELIKERYPKIKIIALTMFDEEEVIIKDNQKWGKWIFV